ncbi:MAG: heat shock protein transcriptional repressor HspR [Actinomycetota bacterium]
MSGLHGMRNEETAVYVISVAAQLAGMHPQTLRIYERRGLLTPARTSGGNRRYSDADIARLRRIADLAQAGMNLEGIRHVMSLEAEIAQLRAQVETLRVALAEAASMLDGRRGSDLVPLRQTVAVFTERPNPFDPGSRKR